MTLEAQLRACIATLRRAITYDLKKKKFSQLDGASASKYDIDDGDTEQRAQLFALGRLCANTACNCHKHGDLHFKVCTFNLTYYTTLYTTLYHTWSLDILYMYVYYFI